MPRILYLHGFSSSPNSSKARHIAAKLREAGANVDVPRLDAGDFEHLTISGQLRVIEDVAAGEPVALIGSSMGGYLAALYAARHAEVSRVVLLAPAFRFAKRWEESMGPAKVADWRAKGSLPVFHFDFYRIGDEQELLALGWDEYLEETAVIIAEWANKFPGCLPADAIWLEFRLLPDGSREVLSYHRPPNG